MPLGQRCIMMISCQCKCMYIYVSIVFLEAQNIPISSVGIQHIIVLSEFQDDKSRALIVLIQI